MNPAIQNAIRILGQGFTRSPGAWGALDPGSLIGSIRKNPRQSAVDVAMQMSSPLMAGRVTPITNNELLMSAGKILNRAEDVSRVAKPLTIYGGVAPDFTKVMELESRAGKLMQEIGKRMKISKKEMGKRTAYELFDLVGKMIRERK